MPRVHGILQTQRVGKTRYRTGGGPVIIKPQSKESLNVKGSKSTDQNVTSSGLAPSLPSLSVHRDSVHHLEQYVETICKEVRTSIEQSTTKKVRRAAEWLRNLVSKTTTESLRTRVTYGLSDLLVHLDGADIDALEKQRTCSRDSPTPPMRKRQRRLPTNKVIQALHESEEAGHLDSDELQLTNSRRHAGLDSTLTISLKDVLNSNFNPNEVRSSNNFAKQDEVITTLSLDAVLLRRDLYTYLASTLLKEVHQPKLISSEATSSQLVERITRAAVHQNLRHKWSPSARLSAVTTLDALRQCDFSDWGYQALLAELLAVNQSADANIADRVDSLKFYAEILAECSAFESPARLFGAISKLMERAVWCDSRATDRSLLRAISYILLRRHNVISSCTRSRQPSKVKPLASAITTYKHFCQLLSSHKLSDWVSADMSLTAREKTVAVLQAEGILTMFLEDESDTDCDESGQVEVDYPYPKLLSLRAAHSRLGPMENMNRLMSHRNAYIGAPMEEEKTNVCHLTGANEDILNNILSCLGFRSLSRVSCVCKAWQKAAMSNSLWAHLYFSRWRKAAYNEELLPSVTAADPYFVGFSTLKIPDQRAAFGASHGYYNFRLLFKQKYVHLKSKNVKASHCCHIVGCTYKVPVSVFHTYCYG